MSSVVDSCSEEFFGNKVKPTNQRKRDRCFTKMDQIEDSLTMEQDVRKDLMKLEIFFQSMTTTIVNEEPKYSVSFHNIS